MFGIYRTALALCVLATHFFSGRGIGAVAVFGFFGLSGFLMTLLMDGPYRGRPFAFLTNRFLRLYPLFWATVFATLLLLWLHDWLPIGLGKPPTYVGLPSSISEFVRQLFFISSMKDNPSLVPTAWAVTNEMIFYALIAAGLSRSLTSSLIWLLGSVIIVLLGAVAENVTANLYYLPWAASLPFAMGAVLYHLRGYMPKLSRNQRLVWVAIAATVLIGIMMLSKAFYFVPWVYLSLIPASAMTLLLFGFRPIGRVDELIGRFSYPIYLMQYLASAAVAAYLISPEHRIEFAVALLLTTIFMSAAFLVFVDTPIQTIRHRLKYGRSVAIAPLQTATA